MARKNPVAHLSRAFDLVPPRLIGEIAATGDTGREQVRAGLSGFRDRDPTWVGNAAFVAGELAWTENRPALLDVLAEAPAGGPAFVGASRGLAAMPDATDLDRLLEIAEDPARRVAVGDVLVELRLDDARIAESLYAEWDLDRLACVRHFNHFPQPSALAALDRVFTRLLEEPDFDEVDAQAVEMVVALIGWHEPDQERYRRRMVAAIEKMSSTTARLRTQLLELEGVLPVFGRGGGLLDVGANAVLGGRR